MSVVLLHCGQGQSEAGTAQVSVRKERSGNSLAKVVRCAGGSSLTKDVKRPSSRTCPDGGGVKGRKLQGSK